jgi:hypothetical protein
MSNYLNTDVLKELSEVRDRIYKERAKIYDKYQIDILDTDSLSALQIYEAVSYTHLRAHETG